MQALDNSSETSGKKPRKQAQDIYVVTIYGMFAGHSGNGTKTMWFSEAKYHNTEKEALATARQYGPGTVKIVKNYGREDELKIDVYNWPANAGQTIL